MKQILAIILCLVMIMGLCSCGLDDKQGSTDDSSKVEIEDSEKNVPAQDMIMTDLQDALYQKNEYATLTSAETIKSLTEEGYYRITLAVGAETKYADWTYEVDLKYIQYDQGWMIDNTIWSSENFEVVRYPETDEMVEYATDYLMNHEVYSDCIYSDSMWPIENASIQYGYNESAEQEVLEFCWDGTNSLKYSENLFRFSSLWQYNIKSDNWTLLEDPNARSGDYGYFLDSTFVETRFLDLDYSGKRDLIDFSGKQISTLEITNFSWESLNAFVPKYMNEVEQFTITDGSSLFPGNDFVYTNGDGDYITFIIESKMVYIYYYANDMSVQSNVEIKEDLPPLS